MKNTTTIRRVVFLEVLIGLIGILLFVPAQGTVFSQQINSNKEFVPSTGDCRFGNTYTDWKLLPNESITRYDLSNLGMGYYLDWGVKRSSSVPGFIRFTPVLRVSDQVYPGVLSQLPALVAANPGAIWLVGNEPDEPRQQDNVTPEVYAERFYQYAQIIRSADPTAKLGFGSIVMPTTLRLMYLDYAWGRLIQLAGSQAAASALVDIWTPHVFMLNEQGGIDPYGFRYWGSDIPTGLQQRLPESEWRAKQEVISDLNDLYNFSMFQSRVIRFRQWMKDQGEQNKPLWITEYGQLAPAWTRPEDNFFTVPESVTADFMIKTIDWMFTQKDATLGLPSDENRLVQKWFWYSINNVTYQFGGTLIDPVTLQVTEVGNAWLNYVPPIGSFVYKNPDLYPVQITPRLSSLNPSNLRLGNYTINVRARNAVIADHFVDVQVTLRDDQYNILGIQKVRGARCGGDAIATFNLTNIPLQQSKTVCVNVQSEGLADINPGNDDQCVVIKNQFFYYMPNTAR
jgi:hypothetical protein